MTINVCLENYFDFFNNFCVFFPTRKKVGRGFQNAFSTTKFLFLR